MSHIKRISQRPQTADAFEETVCFIATALSSLLGFAGGGSPLVDYVADKCFIPPPADGSGGDV